jgi:hypothetical protein
LVGGLAVAPEDPLDPSPETHSLTGALCLAGPKTSPVEPNPSITPDIARPWDVAYLLDYLGPKLPPHAHEFLAALLAAINDPTQAPALDRFPQWRDTPSVPQDAP